MRPIEDDVDRQLLSAAIAKLEDREREIITLRFGLGAKGAAYKKAPGAEVSKSLRPAFCTQF